MLFGRVDFEKSSIKYCIISQAFFKKQVFTFLQSYQTKQCESPSVPVFKHGARLGAAAKN